MPKPRTIKKKNFGRVFTISNGNCGSRVISWRSSTTWFNKSKQGQFIAKPKPQQRALECRPAFRRHKDSRWDWCKTGIRTIPRRTRETRMAYQHAFRKPDFLKSQLVLPLLFWALTSFLFPSLHFRLQTIVKDSEWPGGRAAVDYYFIADSGETFKTTLLYDPYFYIGCKVSKPLSTALLGWPSRSPLRSQPGTETEVEEYLRRRFENVIEKVNRVRKEDLKQV